MTEPLGLTPESLSLIEQCLQRQLHGRASWSVFVFGSRRRGDHKKYSDLDLWIEASPSLSSNELSKLKDAFEESNLPIKVDLVTPETVVPEYRPGIMYEKLLWLRG